MSSITPSMFAGLAARISFSDIVITLIAGLLSLAVAKLPSYLKAVQAWRYYCKGHKEFCTEVGEGKLPPLLKNPFASGTVYWVLNFPAVKKLFSSPSDVDHRAGFDWFHWAAWDIPCYDPVYKDTVRKADTAVHSALLKVKLAPLLSSVEIIGTAEIDRVRDNVGPDGAQVSLHSLLYRIAYNVNLKSIFGPDLDHVRSRVLLQDFAFEANEMLAVFGLPVPLWFSKRFVPRVRRCIKSKDQMHKLLMAWDQGGGLKTASKELQGILGVFDVQNTPVDVRTTFTNMLMTAFLANTPESFGWVFTNLLQAPLMFAAVKAECDALDDDLIVETDFKNVTPHLYSALFETTRIYATMASGSVIKKAITLPGIDHTFQPGDRLIAMGPAAAFSVQNYGADAKFWKGHRFVGEGQDKLQYDLTFGTGRSPCPGRAFAIAELCTLIVKVIRTFDFSDFAITKQLPHNASDFDIMAKAPTEKGFQIIDLDGSYKSIIHPGNASDTGLPGMTSAHIPKLDFACKLTPRV